MNDNLTKYERVWLEVYSRVGSSFNVDSDTATRWADKALERFKARFPQNDLNKDETVER